MSDRAVARLVRRRAAAAGYAKAAFAGHSLRSGFLTAAARAGASVPKMREVSRHKSMQVLADYVRDAELFTTTPARVSCKCLAALQPVYDTGQLFIEVGCRNGSAAFST